MPVSLELGGKGANIVFDDADLDNAVHWAVQAIFRNAGQICLAGSRLYLQAASTTSSSTGSWRRPRRCAAATRRSPAPSSRWRWRARSTSPRWQATSTRVELDGGKILTGGLGEGWSVSPTIIVDAPPTARVCREEIFGPVVRRPASSRPRTRPCAAANDTRYGLNAMVFTENLVARAPRRRRSLRAGTVWVNCFFIRDLRAPFGGVGDSGVGREGGNFSREFFTEPKAVIMQIDGA